MIFIVGIDHKLHQIEASSHQASVTDLQGILQELLDKHQICYITEEFSDEARRAYNMSRTPVQEFAVSNRIPYLFADPNSQERKILGIRTRQDTAVMLGIDIFTATEQQKDQINTNHKDVDILREKEWIERIKSFSGSKVAFFCGFEHATSLLKLLTDQGYKASIYKILDH